MLTHSIMHVLTEYQHFALPGDDTHARMIRSVFPIPLSCETRKQVDIKCNLSQLKRPGLTF